MDLDRAQAEWTLGRYRFRSEELPELAAQMMVLGFEGPAILELVSFHRPMLRDLPRGLVERAFEETGRPPMKRSKAALVLAEPLASAVVSGGRPPREAAMEALRNAPWGEADDLMTYFHRLDELVELWQVYPAERGRYDRLLAEVFREILDRRCDE